MEAQTELPSATGKEAAVTNAKEEQTPSLLERWKHWTPNEIKGEDK